MKKVVALVLVFTMLQTTSLPISAAVTTADIPQSSSEVYQKWVAKLANNGEYGAISNPIIVGNYIYIAEGNNNKVIKYDKSGKVVASAQLNGTFAYGSQICSGDNKIFVPLEEGKVQAFGENDLQSLWISKKALTESGSVLTYENGYVYGVLSGTASWGGEVQEAGGAFALSTTDEDVHNSMETKNFKWNDKAENETFYGNGFRIINNRLIVADVQGKITSMNKENGNDKKSVTLDSGMSGVTPAYDAKDGTFYVATHNTTVYKLSLNNDDSIKIEKSVTVHTGGYSAVSPEVYDGKVYIGGSQKAGDTFNAKGFMAVIDENTMNVEHKTETDGNVQSKPLIKDTVSNGVLVYFTANAMPGSIYCANYKNNTFKVETLYTPEKEQQQLCAYDIVADAEGTLYYRNDSNHLFAIGKKKSEVPPVAKNITYVSTPSKATYTGKSITKKLTVKSGNTTLVLNKDYTVSYTSNKNCGQAKMVIKGIGNYTGTYTKYFYIYPKKAALSKLKASKKKAKVSIKKNGGSVSGYQIRYSKYKSFKKSKYKTTSKRTYTIKKLKSKKNIYVKVRAYKKVGSKKLYGSWSKYKKVRVK